MRDRPRVIALALIERSDRSGLLVSSGYDPSVGRPYHRLLGGGVDFGERGEDAVKRELAEEIGAAIIVDCQVGVVENIFVYDGRPGHEIALIYVAQFADDRLYSLDELAGIEDDPVDALWHPWVGPGSEVPVYPPGAVELLGR